MANEFIMKIVYEGEIDEATVRGRSTFLWRKTIENILKKRKGRNLNIKVKHSCVITNMSLE